ncbi:hypothetical protein [Bacillus thuringiensis]|uniref:hypothetical protein n=1 Tax=Bacillus thuringiensis TaxID=1428 RepID=UPI000BFDAFF1|nr:hypothetical protein [Bacillus thuringiensis]PGT89900.1 hypothetical protein COD17_09115 [Bacillus thuringiensis]
MGTLKAKLVNKEVAFNLALIMFGLATFQFTSHLDFVNRLLYRLVIVTAVMFLYRKFINKGEMKTEVNKWRLKGWVHYAVFIVGIVEFVGVVIIKRVGHIQTMQPTEAIQVLSVAGLVAMVLSVLVCIPIMYFMVQSILYFRIFTVWVYNNKRRWFEVSLLLDEVLLVTLVSLLN